MYVQLNLHSIVLPAKSKRCASARKMRSYVEEEKPGLGLVSYKKIKEQLKYKNKIAM